MRTIFRILLLWAILAAPLAPSALADEAADPIESFLIQLFTVDVRDFASMDDPAEDYPAYLSHRLGAYCTQEALDELLLSRFPFSLAEACVRLDVQSVQIKPLNPETAGEGRASFQVKALAERPDGSFETVALTGRVRLDVQTGRIVGLRLNFPQ